MKFFNTGGPVVLEDHYMIDPLSRINLDDVMLLIDQKKYFVLHAPRQTGKTSLLKALMTHINQAGHYTCLYVNVEIGQAAREDVRDAMASIIAMMANQAALYLGDRWLKNNLKRLQSLDGSQIMLHNALAEWCEVLDKPLVLFIDEIDALVGDTLISILRQLRAGYADRPTGFPQSVTLCGVRDVRDYRIHASSEKASITGGSAFNVKVESLRLGNFSQAETEALLQQHTDTTGQVFDAQARQSLFQFTQGQPWLVNALAYEVTSKMKANRDRSVVITAPMIAQAKENLILLRETHLDQLVDKLKEPRVHRVIAPILAGAALSTDMLVDDIEYVYDLGLIEKKPQIRIANPIYQEVIPRELAWPIQVTLSQEADWYLDKGLLQMDKLIAAFQAFFRQHSEHWTDVYQYKEAGPQLLLQAFLQRIVNGGGRIEREYGLGAGRTDLYLEWEHATGIQQVILELKLQYGSRQATIDEALPQITGYMDRCDTDEGHLLLFNRTKASWDEKIFRDQTSYAGKRIHIWGM
ncbi:MAG: AAA-like domain-containing protein [Kangiellaceae bacterium]|nr:AAA-like domain-containing protein [Kangiellaceae bacterium]